MHKSAALFLLAALFAAVESAPGRESRVIDGETAVQGQFPYMVSIMDTTGFIDRPICGGVILNDNHVLTSASCVNDYQDAELAVRAGEITFSIDTGYEEQRTIKVRETHNYNPTNKVNDISILKLDTNWVFVKGDIAPAVLAGNYEELPDPTTCITMGYGSLTVVDGSTSDTLQYTEVDYVTDEDCNGYYGDGTILSDMLCAGNSMTNSSLCTGDFGGPLICNGVVHGVASWQTGTYCGENPTVFTQVSHYIDWINQFIEA